MDRAIWVSSLALIGSAVVSYFLISDDVVKAHLTEPAAPLVEGQAEERLALVPGD